MQAILEIYRQGHITWFSTLCEGAKNKEKNLVENVLFKVKVSQLVINEITTKFVV